MAATVTDANVTTRTGETAFRRVPLQRHVVRALYEFPLASCPESGLFYVRTSNERRSLAERWRQIAVFETAVSDEFTSASASATSTLVSALRTIFDAINTEERVDKGTYSPAYSRRVLFTQAVEVRIAELPRRRSRAYVDRRTLEGNDAD